PCIMRQQGRLAPTGHPQRRRRQERFGSNLRSRRITGRSYRSLSLSVAANGVWNHDQEKVVSDRTLLLDGVRVPRFLYGTAWKEDQTQRLTELALRQGFRGIDTANQRRHYHEAAVGQAIAAAVEAGLAVRDGLFLQTKFTFRAGQDQ